MRRKEAQQNIVEYKTYTKFRNQLQGELLPFAAGECCFFFLQFAVIFIANLLFFFCSFICTKKKKSTATHASVSSVPFRSDKNKNFSFPEIILTASSLEDYNLLEVHYEGVRYACAVCKKTYARKKTLGRHLRLECGKNPTFRCPDCSQMFKHGYELIRHLRSIHLKNIHKLRNRK